MRTFPSGSRTVRRLLPILKKQAGLHGNLIESIQQTNGRAYNELRESGEFGKFGDFGEGKRP